MELKFLVPNNAWAFVYGDSIIPMGDHPMFFTRRSEAVSAAAGQGLTVHKNGKVEAA